MKSAKIALVALTVGALTGCYTDQLNKPRRYACSPDGGAEQCLSGWVCKQDGYCHDPSVGEPLACATSADCIGGWHCGVSGVCYDVADAGEVACRPENDAADAGAGSDCAPGWRCGLEKTCHDRMVAAAYLCNDDSSCEGGWRCGIDGRCVTVEAEALRASAHHDDFVLDRIGPVRIDPKDITPGPRFRGVADLAIRTDGGFALVSEPGDWSTALFARASPDAIAATMGGLLYVAEGSHITGYNGIDDPEGSPGSGDFSFAPKRLVALPTLPSATLVAFSDTEMQVGELRPIYATPNTVQLRDDGSAVRINDMAYAAERADVFGSYEPPLPNPDTTGNVLAVATEDGVRVVVVNPYGSYSLFDPLDGGSPALQSAFPFLPLQGIKTAPCGGAGAEPLRVRAAATPGADAFWLGVETKDAGTSFLSLYESVNLSNVGGIDCSSSPATRKLNACLACPPGGTLLDFDVIAANDWQGTARVVILCSVPTADGGTNQARIELAGSCTGQGQVAVNDDDRVGHGDPIAVASNGMSPLFVGADGVLFSCLDRDLGFLKCDPLQYREEPWAFAETRDGGYAGWAPSTSVRSTPVGLVTAPPVTFFSPVRGAPGLVAAGDGIIDLDLWDNYEDHVAELEGVARIPSDAGVSLEAHAVKYHAAGGEERVAATSSDGFYEGTIDPESLPSLLNVRAVPLTKAAITSLAMLDLSDSPSDGGTFAEGYAVAGQRLFHITADIPTRWRADEVLLGADVPLAVWADGSRARVGLADGRVLSLPGRVEIAPKLADVGTFEEVCGDAYALVGSTPYLLEADGGVGTWQPVTAAQVPNADWNRISFGDGKLLLTGWGGRAVALRPKNGCPTK